MWRSAGISNPYAASSQDYLDEEESEAVKVPSPLTQTSETRLLQDVFPEHVVKQLQAGKKVEPESFDQARKTALTGNRGHWPPQGHLLDTERLGCVALVYSSMYLSPSSFDA